MTFLYEESVRPILVLQSSIIFANLGRSDFKLCGFGGYTGTAVDPNNWHAMKASTNAIPGG